MLESISLEIANYWTSNGFLTETNKNCGTLVAFDWKERDGEYYLSEINTNIDLGELESKNFKYDDFIKFLKNYNFKILLGLVNVVGGPDREWLYRLNLLTKGNNIDYEEFVVDTYPTPVPEFDIPDNVFILRYSYDEYSAIDRMAANQYEFKTFINKSKWKKYYKECHGEKKRVIVFCSDKENLVLHEEFVK